MIQSSNNSPGGLVPECTTNDSTPHREAYSRKVIRNHIVTYEHIQTHKEDTMLERNFFTQDELALYDWRYSNYSFEQFYDELVRLGARTKRRKRDDDDYDLNPNRFLCDKIWNKRSNR